MPEWMAEVKAELAKLGQTLHPAADLTMIEKPPPGSATNLVVLDRVTGEVPDYCVHGYATCVQCDTVCWLGSETVTLVSRKDAYPICMECMTKLMPQAKPGWNANDHRRADGPH